LVIFPSPQSKVNGIDGPRLSTPLTVTFPVVTSNVCRPALKLEGFPNSAFLKLKEVVGVVVAVVVMVAIGVVVINEVITVGVGIVVVDVIVVVVVDGSGVAGVSVVGATVSVDIGTDVVVDLCLMTGLQALEIIITNSKDMNKIRFMFIVSFIYYESDLPPIAAPFVMWSFRPTKPRVPVFGNS